MGGEAMAGWIGGIVGSVIGILGGLFGTWCSIRNTNSPREREFVVKASVMCWVFVGGFLAAMFLIPSPFRFLLWIPYPFLLVAGIVYWNRGQQRIREEDEADRQTTHRHES